jgi:hypothetical protein
VRGAARLPALVLGLALAGCGREEGFVSACHEGGENIAACRCAATILSQEISQSDTRDAIFRAVIESDGRPQGGRDGFARAAHMSGYRAEQALSMLSAAEVNIADPRRCNSRIFMPWTAPEKADFIESCMGGQGAGAGAQCLCLADGIGEALQQEQRSAFRVARFNARHAADGQAAMEAALPVELVGISEQSYLSLSGRLATLSDGIRAQCGAD